MFVIDASTSVGLSNFGLVKDYVQSLVENFEVDAGFIRVGVIIFNQNDIVQFHLNTYPFRSEVLTAIDNIPYPGGSGNIADALKTVRTVMFTPINGDRANVPNTVILIVDGASNVNSGSTISEATLTKAAGIHIIGVGINMGNTNELDQIVSSPLEQNRFRSNFGLLGNIKNRVLSAFCGMYIQDLPCSLQ